MGISVFTRDKVSANNVKEEISSACDTSLAAQTPCFGIVQTPMIPQLNTAGFPSSPFFQSRFSRRSWITGVSAALTAGWPRGAWAQPPWGRFVYTPTRGKGANRLEIIQGVPVLVVQESKPKELGAEIGRLALGQGKALSTYPKALVSHFKVDALWPFLVGMGERMVKKFPERFQTELAAMQEYSGATRADLVAGNTLFDLKQMVLCSGIGVDRTRSATGGPLLGRNLDYPPVGDIGQYTLVQVIRQGKGFLNYASVGFPGLLGVLSGINEAGLALAIHEVVDIRPPKRKFNPAGLPYALCYRMVLEQCKTVEEARNFLLSLQRSTTTNLLISDREKTAVLEVSPDDVRMRPAEVGASCCANHFCLAENKADNQANPYQSFERYAVLQKGCEDSGKLDIGSVKKLLHQTNLGLNTLQSMVFECAPLKLHLAYGPPPASAGPYRELNLEPFLKP